MILRKALSPRDLRIPALFALAVVYLWFALRNYGYELDDALIYMRYVQNLIDGNGLAYNKGERFDGLTSPIYSYATAVVASLTRNVHFATWLVSALSTFAAFLVLFSIFWRQLPLVSAIPRASAIIGLILSITMPYFFSTYGMETGLFALFCALTLKSYLERRWDSFFIWATLLCLTRPEGVFLAVACGLYFVVATRKLPPLRWKTLATALALVACVAAANLYFFHTLWAETGAAKIWQGKSGYWGEGLIFWNISYLAGLTFADSMTSVTIMLTAAAIGIIALGKSELNVVVLVFLILYGMFYTVLNIPNYHWYYSAYFLLLPFYAAAGSGYVASTLVRGDPAARARVLAGTILLTSLYPVCEFVPADWVRKESRGAPYAQAGLWIEQHTPPDSSFAADEIGALGWYSKRKVIDILGLVNPGNARLIGERNFDGWMDSYRPDYLLLHDPITGLEMSLYTFVNRHALIQECGFPVRGYAFYKIEYTHGPSSFCDPNGNLQPVGIVSPANLAPKNQGHIDSIVVVGNFVRITGWATNGGHGAFTELLVPQGHEVEFGLYQRYSRPDVAKVWDNPAFEQSGFDLALRFPRHDLAKAWAQAPCLLSRREGNGSPMPLNDTDSGACGPTLPFTNGFE